MTEILYAYVVLLIIAAAGIAAAGRSFDSTALGSGLPPVLH